MSSLAALEGRSWPSAAPFEVGREHVRAFARVVGASASVHFDVQAARSAGFEDLVAPVTFVATVAQQSEWLLWGDPQVGIDFQRVVHGEERIEIVRPIVAGDVLSAELLIERVREVRGNTMLTTRTDLSGADGVRLASVWSMIVVRADEVEGDS
ncbi:FAS1-like dehydratase domain-containing protein [Dermatophilus congolensis]|nr:MaoC family dehydratase N-terminal domain-containing protein [Dermatophilus congolensis]